MYTLLAFVVVGLIAYAALSRPWRKARHARPALRRAQTTRMPDRSGWDQQ
jgi:hypothetical protein